MCVVVTVVVFLIHMDVSENSGFSTQIIHLNRGFHYKPSILGYHYFWKHQHTQSTFVAILQEMEQRSSAGLKSHFSKVKPLTAGHANQEQLLHLDADNHGDSDENNEDDEDEEEEEENEE